MMKVIYDTTEDCRGCPYNHDRICTKLCKYLWDICFERDCPLPTLEDVESFTRYITPKKSLECHGNCRNWERWDYNKHIRTDLGVCKSCEIVKICHANGEACEEFDEI